MDEKFDELIKNKLDNEVNSIPDKINNHIDETLGSLNKEKSKSFLVKVALLCLIVLLGLKTVAVTVMAVSIGIPVKDVIYESLGLSKRYQDYSSDINVTKECNGIKLTITSAIFDGYKLRLAYTVESDEKLNFHDSSFMLDATNINMNDKNVFNGGNGTGIQVDDYSFNGVVVVDLQQKSNIITKIFGVEEIDVLDTFEVNIKKVVRINDKDYKWDFNIPISSSIMKEDIKEYKVKYKNDDGDINKIVVTPISIYVSGTFNRIDKQNMANEVPNYLVIDDKGREYGMVSSGLSSSLTTSLLKGRMTGEFEKEYENIYGDAGSIRFIPYNYKEEYTGNIVQLDKEVMKVELKNNEFRYSDDNEIKIVNVIREGGKTKIFYKTQYPLTAYFNLNDELLEGSRDVLDDGTAVLTINTELEDGVYEFNYEDVNKVFNIYEDNSFSLELK